MNTKLRRNLHRALLSSVLLLSYSASGIKRASAQALVQGRFRASDQNAPDEQIALSAILTTMSLPGSGSEPSTFRTWETHPAGWFRLSGLAGRHTIALTNPAHFARPRILTNQYLSDGDSLELRPPAAFDFASFHDRSWDPKPANRYWQPFRARGADVTAVGFKLATDGVDGAGPGKQDVLISIHRRTGEDPTRWPQIGPTATVLGVDCGGPKSYWYSAGWCSGEVPTEPGLEYAVSLRPKEPDGKFQAFWRPRPGGSPGAFRTGLETRGFTPHDLWLAVSSGGDGLLIPYQKRVHHRYHELTTLEKTWSQTWIAQGRGLASVVLYAAVSGKQPPLSRQRVRVRVRQGGPQGPVVGVEKIGVGNGNYTGDASWGHFVAVFAPGEVRLQPGELYALEFESLESLHTIGGFVNIKKQVSDGRAGFNPYRKCPPDDYPAGAAYQRGTIERDFDLDLQIVEYEHHAPQWQDATAGRNLLTNGSMEEVAKGWTPFATDAGESGTGHREAADEKLAGRFLRIASADPGKPIDGGWHQRIEGLSHQETYRLRGRVRSTWAADVDRRCEIGIDPSGQTSSATASTIEWRTVNARHGEFLEYVSRPTRPDADALSIWLRARCAKEDPRFPFRADFDEFALHRVDRGVPIPDRREARRGLRDSIPKEPLEARAGRVELVRRRRSYTPVLVHRGATRFAPENTLAAFSAAIDRGADGFEVDIRSTADGVLYVFHDETLDRTTDRTGPVLGLAYFDLLDCALTDGHRIPTLASVLTLARERAALLHLDVKEPGLETEILRLIDEADLWEHIVEVNPGNAASIRDHQRIRRMGYKGWFPEASKETPKPSPEQRAFLSRPGNMVFTKWDPLDAVNALGRRKRESRDLPADLDAWWERGRSGRPR